MKNNNENNIYINRVRNRILCLSPTVEAGIERECTKDDFYSEDNKEIGRGGFSHVYKVSHKNTGKIYVIKLMCKQDIINKNMVEQINREVKIMYKINHPHIIKLINHFEDDENVYLIMELGAKGQLYSLLKKFSHGLDQIRVAQYMREIISAVKYLHELDPPIIHRDIKPENILLDSNNRCKLADFGWSNFISPNTVRKTFCGTPQYISPEMLSREGHGPEVDIWALGVLCFELLTCNTPFNGNNESEIYQNIKALNIDWQGDDFNPLAKNLIIKILKFNPKDRPSLDEILAHPWFESFPPTMPLLEVKKISHEEYLEEHTISISKKEDANENKILTQKKTEITDVVKKINSSNNNTSSQQSNINNIESNNNNNQINKDKDEKEKINDKKDIDLDKIMKEKIDSIVSPLNNIIDSQSNLIAEMKQKNDKYVLEIDTLKKVLNSIKEQQTEIDNLKGEINKYKEMNTERLNLLAEIEKNNKTIHSLENKLKEKEENIKNLEKNNRDLNEQINQNKNIITSLEKKINDLNKQIQETLTSKENEISDLTKKINNLKKTILEKVSSKDKSNKDSLIEIVNMSVTDLQDTLNSKTDKIYELLKNIQDEVINSIKKPSEFIENMNQELKILTQTTKNNLEEVNKNSITIIENEIKSKLQLQLDWQNKQIDELMEYKIKAKIFETKINSLEMKIKNMEEEHEIVKNQNANLQKVLELKEEKNKDINNRLIDIENYNAYLKDFIIRERSIDEFEDFLENLGK